MRMNCTQLDIEKQVFRYKDFYMRVLIIMLCVMVYAIHLVKKRLITIVKTVQGLYLNLNQEKRKSL